MLELDARCGTGLSVVIYPGLARLRRATNVARNGPTGACGARYVAGNGPTGSGLDRGASGLT